MRKMIIVEKCGDCPVIKKCSLFKKKGAKLSFFCGHEMPDLHPKCKLPDAPDDDDDDDDDATDGFENYDEEDIYSCSEYH